MPGIIVGSASVTIVPDATSFGPRLSAGIDPEVQKLGESIGRQLGDRITSAIQDGLRDGLRNAPTGDAAKAGASTGGSFADAFKAKVEQAMRSLPEGKVGIDSTEADQKLDDLRARLANLANTRLDVDLSAADATAELDKIRAELDEVARDSADINVRADIDRAQASLSQIRAEVDRLNGDTATVDVKVDDQGSTAATEREISGLKSSLIGLAPAAIPVGAALVGGFAGLSTVLAAAAGGLGVFALGISGVSDAVKLLGQQQAAAAADAVRQAQAATQQAAAEKAAAQQVQSAQQSLADARRSAAQGEQDAAEKVTQAEQSLADARRQAAQAAQDAAEKVQQAKQAEADAVRTAADQERQALQQVQQAEYSLTQANEQARDAQQALNDAREQAARDLESYADRAVDANLNLQQSQIDLTTAQEKYDADLADPSVSPAQLQQDALNVAKAKQALVEAQQDLTNSTEDNTKAQKDGVDGSPAVVAAAKALADAKHAQKEAEQQLAEAQRAEAEQAQQSAEAVQKAQQAVADAQRDAARQQVQSAEQISKAEHGVSDAVRDQTREQQSSAEAITRAQQQVAQAMQQAAAASKGAGETGTSSLASVNAELAKVNPATLAFAKFVQGSLAPAFDKLKASAAGGLLPGLEDGLKAMMPLFPSLNRFVGTLAASMGRLFDQAGHALTSPFWRQFFTYMERSAGPIIQTLGRVIGNLAQGFAGLVEAFAPVTKMIGGGLLSLSRMFADFGKGAAGNSGFQAFLGYIRANAPIVVDALGKIVEIAGKLIEGLAPLGHVLIVVIDKIADFLSKLSPTQLLLVVGAVGALVAALGGPLTAAAVAATAAAALIVDNWSKIQPVVQPVINVFRDIWGFITNQLVPVLKGILLQAWAGIESAIHTVNEAIQAHKAQLTELVNAFKDIVGFIVEKVLPILGPVLKGAFELLGESFKITIQEISWLVDAFNGIVTAGKAVGAWFSGPFVDFFTTGWSEITGAFSTAWNWVKSTWSSLWAGVKAIVTTPISDAKAYLSSKWQEIEEVFRLEWQWVKQTWSMLWNGVKDVVTTPIHNAKLALDGIWSNLQGAFSDVASWVTGAWNRVWSAVKDVITTPVHAAKLALDTVWGNVQGAFSDVAGWATTTFDKAWSAIKNVLVSPARAAMDVFRDIFGSGGVLRGLLREAVDAVESIWHGLENIFKAPIKFLINTVLNDGLIWAWNKLADILPGVSEIKTIPLPKGFAVGGAVTGPGGPTDDRIPAMLSNNEHVWTAREVAAAGGHAAVAKMRAAALGNDEPRYYADGGAVTAAGVKEFIRAQGPKPYEWDEAGPGGYDCSGLVSAVYNLINGDNPYRHTFSTSDEAGYFAPGPGVFTVGVTHNSSEQHTAGNFDGLGFEARDTQQGILIGSSAAPPSAFATVLHMPRAEVLGTGGVSGTVGGSGGIGGIIGTVGGIVSGGLDDLNPLHYLDEFKQWITKPLNAIKKYAGTPVGDLLTSVPGAIAGDMESAIKNAAESLIGLGSGGGTTGGSGGVTVGPHTDAITAALNYVKVPATGTNLDAVNIIASNESGWSPTAVNRSDSNWQAGHPSVGLMQVIEGTFDRWVPNALKNTGPFAYGVSEDPLANMAAGIRYAIGTYGSLPNVPGVVAVHNGEPYVGYDSGGWLQPGPTLTYNGTGTPEAVLTSSQWDSMATLAGQGGGELRLHPDDRALLAAVADRPVRLITTRQGETVIGEIANEHRQERRLHGDPAYT